MRRLPTDLHVVDGELPNPKLPLVPGHEIVGRIEDIGEGVARYRPGERVGIPWVGWTCGQCAFCLSNRENLCSRARFTGYTIDGGYADYTSPMPVLFSAANASIAPPPPAPLRWTDLDIDPFARQATRNASGSTDLVPPHTSSRRLRDFRDARSSHLRDLATWRRRNLPAGWARFGLEVPMNRLRRSSMRQSFLRPLDPLFRVLSAPWKRAARWSAAESI